MFCPRCSQEQISEEIRYCSRCGLPLGLIAQIVVGEGSLPRSAETGEEPKRWLTRSRGWKFGLTWFLVLTFFLAPIFAILEIDGLPEITAFLGIMGGLLITVFSFVFLKNGPRTATEQLGPAPKAIEYDAVHGRTTQYALPPQETLPASAYIPPTGSWKAPETEDLAQPGSVTESTTKLLEKDE